MKILFAKEKSQPATGMPATGLPATGLPATIKCVRADGTETCMRINHHFTLEHDLIHYAIERALKFGNGFYGLIDQGYSISDFRAPRSQRPAALLPGNLPKEAHQTEILADLFQTELPEELELEDFIDIARITFDAQQVKFPEITEEHVGTIRADIRSLLHHWHYLPAGQVLALDFAVSGSRELPERSHPSAD